jgi:leader peptidase (prepilin peptidase)/N-methyltransferase
VYAAYGAAVVGGLFLLTFIVSRGRVLGFGDVVLAVSMGMLLGAFDGLLAVWVACVLGSVYGVGQIVLRTGSMDRQAPTKKILQHQVPFGPFLIAGLLVVFLKYASFEGLFDMVPLLTLYSL